MMMWDDYQNQTENQDQDSRSHLNFDFPFPYLKAQGDYDYNTALTTLFSADYYKILEVDYDASEDTIRSNYIRLALKWHPDKQKVEDSATSRFQEINEAYQVLSDPIRRREYDDKGMFYVYDYNLIEYLNRYKGLILTCNGLGIRQSIW